VNPRKKASSKLKVPTSHPFIVDSNEEQTTSNEEEEGEEPDAESSDNE
jgi:hypothetical protein